MINPFAQSNFLSTIVWEGDVVFEHIIRNGTVVDGTGNVGFKANVAVADGRLFILVGDSSATEAGTTIDASGCIVCPGFIDVHTHSDLMALAEPLDEPKTMMGVTTDMIGLDGMAKAEKESLVDRAKQRVVDDYNHNVVIKRLEKIYEAEYTDNG